MLKDFPQTSLSRLQRKPFKGSHDRATIYGILDAAVVCHIGYIADGQALATPMLFWRDGATLYWHGSARGRAILAHAAGQKVCVTVAHLDAFNLGRSGIASSVQFRSVMAFGTTAAITDRAQKQHQMTRFIERMFPGRTASQRAIHDAELDAITVIGMPIGEASAKINARGPVETTEDDYDTKIWAGVIPVRMTIGDAVVDTRVAVPPALPEDLAAHYQEGAGLDAALTWAADRTRAG